MKKLPIYLFIVACSCLLFACEKNIPTYSGEKNIYFSNTADTSKITFAYYQSTTKDTTISIRVYTTGPVSDVDREFSVKFIDSPNSAIKNVHFALLNEKFVIKANEAFTNLRFKLYRLPEMLTKTYYINMQLETNENFNTNYNWEWVSLKNKTWRQLLMYTIRFDDVLAQPKTWIPSIMGAFTRKKLYMLSDFFGLDISIWNVTGAGGISATLMPTYGKVFQRYLNDEAAKGNIIYEDDGSVMVMGPSSQ